MTSPRPSGPIFSPLYGIRGGERSITIMDIKVDAGSGAVLSVEKDHEDRDTDKRDESRENNDGEDKD